MRIFSVKPLLATVVFFAGFGLSAAAKADSIEIGPATLTQGSGSDSCTRCAFVTDQAFSAGYTVTSFSIDANKAGTIIPILFTLSGDTLTAVGIGEAVTATVGINTFAFDLQSGTAATTDATYFGFYGGGVVGFNFTGTTGETFSLGNLVNGQVIQTGSTYTEVVSSPAPQNNLGQLDARLYELNATAVNATPEPGTLSLLSLGFAALGGFARFRRR
jgi:hypothetical protein